MASSACVSFDLRFFVKEDGHFAKLNFSMPGIKVIHIVPAVHVKVALNECFSQKKMHLLTRHARAYLLGHFLGDEISLRNVNSVNVAVVVAAGKCESAGGDKWQYQLRFCHRKNRFNRIRPTD